MFNLEIPRDLKGKDRDRAKLLIVIDRVIEILLILTVMSSPLVFSYKTTKMFMVAKETVNQILIILTFSIWTFRIIITKNFSFVKSPLNWPILIFLGIHALSIFAADSVYLALRDFWRFLNYFILFYLTINNIRRPKRIKLIVFIVILTALINGVYGMLQASGYDPLFQVSESGRQKIFGFFGNPNFLAGYLNICLPLAIASIFMPDRLYSVFGMLASPVILFGLIVTLTRSAWIAFSISALFFLGLMVWGGTLSFKKVFKMKVLFLIVALFLWFAIRGGQTVKMYHDVSNIGNRIKSIGNTTQYNARQRFMMWKMCALMVRDNPILGVGIGNFKHSFFRIQADWYKSHLKEMDIPFIGKVMQGDELYDWYKDVAVSPIRAHNEYLQTAAELGFTGITVFIWLMIILFTRGLMLFSKIKSKSARIIYAGAMSSIVAVLMVSFFSFPFHRPAVVLLFWFLAGLICLPSHIFLRWDDKQYFSDIEEKTIRRDLKFLDTTSTSFIISVAVIVICASIAVWTVVKLHIGNVMMKQGLNTQILAGRYKAKAESSRLTGKENEFNAYNEHSLRLYAEAMVFYKKALTYDPNFGETQFRMGQTYDSLNMPKKAITAFLESLNNIQSKYTYFSLGNIYQRLGDYENTMKWHNRLVTIMPSYLEGHYSLGLIYLTKYKDYARALFHWNEILSPCYYIGVNPGLKQKTYFNVAEIYRAKGDLENAVYNYSEGLKYGFSDKKAAIYLSELANKLYK